MKTSHSLRDKIFRDIHFYQPKNHETTISKTIFQNKNGNKEVNTFRKKGQTIFLDHKYSSLLNPLNRNKGRYDRPYKQTYQRKKQIQKLSNFKSDPFSSKTIKQKQIPLRKQFYCSKQYKIENERKFFLPSQRQILRPYKHYHSQLGLSLQRESSLRRRDNFDSSLMKMSLSYAMERSLGKIQSYNTNY